MARQGRRDTRSDEAKQYRRLYSDKRWCGPSGVRARQLAAHPLCAMCEAAGRGTPATVCDHVDPSSKATEQGFFEGPFQSLCDAPPWRCHSRVKQSEERRAKDGRLPLSPCGEDGWPTHPAHPWNR